MFWLLMLAATAGIGYYVATKPPVNPTPGTATTAGPQVGQLSLGNIPVTQASLQGNAGGPSTSQLVGFGSGAATSGVGIAASTGLISASGSLAEAVPIAGAVIGIGLGIMNMISAHHKAALAAEGKALNDATPRMVQTFQLIVQAAMNGEITSMTQAQGLVATTISAWYGEVKPIQRGTWHYTGADMSADYVKVWQQRVQPPSGAPGYSDYHAPDPCNAACVMGHFFAERNGLLALYAVQAILAGQHGTVVFPVIPAYATQQGYPQIVVNY
jgi:hypothetical protein